MENELTFKKWNKIDLPELSANTAWMKQPHSGSGEGSPVPFSECPYAQLPSAQAAGHQFSAKSHPRSFKPLLSQSKPKPISFVHPHLYPQETIYRLQNTLQRFKSAKKSSAKHNSMKSHQRIIAAISSKGTKACILKQMARAATKMENSLANQDQGTPACRRES